jgi:hypothetical protein
MSPRRNIPFLNSRWTALWLVLLQLGVIGLGHPLHQWMHESAHLAARAVHSGHGTCGGCPAETADSRAIASHSDCCASVCESSVCESNCSENSENSPGINERGTGLTTPAPHRCWSWDCAFFRGMHQPLTVTQPATLVGLDLPSIEFLLPADLSAEIGEHFSLRARGPPQA